MDKILDKLNEKIANAANENGARFYRDIKSSYLKGETNCGLFSDGSLYFDLKFVEVQ